MRRVLMAVGAVIVACALAGSIWWYVKDHERVGVASLERTVARKAGAYRAVCVKRDANAARWLCVAIGPPAPRCFRAHVRLWGAVELHKAYRRCAQNVALAAYLDAASQ